MPANPSKPSERFRRRNVTRRRVIHRSQCNLFSTVEEGLRRLGVRVVVDAALLVNVGDLQVEVPLARADLANAFEKLVEIVLAKALVQLEPLVIERTLLTMNSRRGCVAQMRN